MQTKRIKCPQCGVVLDVKNSKNEGIKQVTCPMCNAVLRVHFLIPQGVKKGEESRQNVLVKQSTMKFGEIRMVDGVQTKRIHCPVCRVVLDVKNSSKELQKQIACPCCNSVLQVAFPPQKHNDE